MIIANNNNKSQLVVLSGPVPISVSLGKIDLWEQQWQSADFCFLIVNHLVKNGQKCDL